MASGESANFLDSFGVTIEGVSNVVRINQRRTPKVRLFSLIMITRREP